MNSNDCDFDDRNCVLCQDSCPNMKTEFYDKKLTAKVVHNCRKYLHTVITGNDFKERLISAECQQLPVICAQCFATALRLGELDDQLEILQKSINDFSLIFSLTILHRRTTRTNGQQRNGIVELDIRKFSGVFNETDLLINNIEQDPLLVRSPQANVRFETREMDNELNIKNEEQESTIINENVFLDEDIFLNTSQQSEFNEDESVPAIVNEESDGNSKTQRNKECSNGFQIVLERLQFPIKPNGTLIQLQENNDCVVLTNSLTDEEIQSEMLSPNRSCGNTTSLQQNPANFPAIERSNSPLQRKIVNQTQDAEKSYTCFHCKASFAQRCFLNRHMKTHTGDKPFKCDVCPKAFSQSRHLTGHMRTHQGENRFHCLVCPEVFANNISLIDHMRTHKAEKRYKCSSCSSTYSQSHNLTKHKRKMHGGEKPYKCSLCEKAFAINISLTKHMREKHKGEKPYKCSVCQKAFSLKMGLTEHMRTHKAEKRYKCSYCSNAYSLNHNLTAHMRKMHAVEKNQTHKCSVCPRTFADKSRLRIHALNHKKVRPFKCPSCPKSFSQNCSLTRHLKIHTGEKPFKCSVCSKAFTYSFRLVTHSRTHV